MSTDIKQKLIAAGIAAALPLIVLFEGTRQTAYLDPVSIPTICRGHTGGVKLGQTATIEQCDDMTVQDLLKAKASMESCLKVPLNDNQRAAFTSFVFNVGPGRKGVKDGFCVLESGKPSTMITLLNKGDYTGACNQMQYWNKAGGVVYSGLTKRRAAERELCLKPV
ncbi:lysozyme [Undibacterium umbellatum]|uniref:Lysozyme n=1 Tax=Undibacterium umbellatum TaxID=2762300 RepID=A0ABR6Z8E3_9BURK|nr:lysozyme [Undibacterium umbellatum]MBC3907889.1 lysozyme [Undibacterium umbellatum]